jgi:6-phosphogluconolactonase
VFVPRLEQWRVTLTMPVIRHAKLRIVLATGASKAPILRDVREGVRHPIALATDGVETWWFVDKAAAGYWLGT